MLIGVGATLLYLTAADFVISIKPAVSFEDMLDGKEVQVGSRVAGEVVFAMDYFASESTYTRYEDGSRSGSRKSGNYYLIPTAEGYIALKSRQADVSALDALWKSLDTARRRSTRLVNRLSYGILILLPCSPCLPQRC